MNKTLKTIINLVLIVVIVVFVIGIYNKIMDPIKFQKAYEHRSNIVIEKMTKIRDVELAYLDKYSKYTADFDTLLNFIKYDSVIVVKSYGSVPDSIYILAKYNKKEAEKKALELGIITRDTIRISVIDTLFKEGGYDTLKYIPYTNLTETFQIQAGSLKTLSNLVRPVFELKAHNNSFTNGLKKQLVINLNDKARDNNMFPGFTIGSMTEVTTAGNWN